MIISDSYRINISISMTSNYLLTVGIELLRSTQYFRPWKKSETVKKRAKGAIEIDRPPLSPLWHSCRTVCTVGLYCYAFCSSSGLIVRQPEGILT